MTVDNEPATKRDYEFNNELLKKFNKEKIANSKKWESTTAYTESVFENKNLYVIIKVQTIQNNQLTRNSEGDITFIEPGFKTITVNIRVCSKIFSNIDINEFMTYQQKEQIKSRIKSTELIDKALQK